jgi:hypothetical protein
MATPKPKPKPKAKPMPKDAMDGGIETKPGSKGSRKKK